MSRRVISLAYIALLLFAQHASVLHAIWHAHAGQEQQQTVGSEDKRQTQPLGAQLCGFEAVFAQVLGGGLGACSAPVLHDPVATPATLDAESSFSTSFLAPLSRGPPAHL